MKKYVLSAYDSVYSVKLQFTTNTPLLCSQFKTMLSHKSQTVFYPLMKTTFRCSLDCVPASTFCRNLW